MNPRSKSSAGLAVMALLVSASTGRSAEYKPVASCSPALEAAATALAKPDLVLANRHFAEVSQDPSAAPLVRGIGRIGIAETALARGETNAAIQAWQRMSEEADTPPWQRDLAKRRIVETERRLKGLPERDPAAYRATLPVLPKPAMTFHVSPQGSDSAPGTEARPFATLARARDAIRELKKSRGGSLPEGGVKVLVRDGSHARGETLRLSAEDSGTAAAPVVFEAASQNAVFQGGLPVKGWKPISDPAVRERLSPAVRALVLEADLKAVGITEWGDPTALKKRPELFVNGVPQTLARWPNEGFVKTGDILGQDTFKVWGSISGCKDGKFRFVEDRAKEWLDEPDVRLYGYWFWDWYEEYQQVASIDAAQSSFTLAKPYSSYGYRKGQRYFAVNVFRELDQPGEWYLDRRIGKVYWLPPEGVEVSGADVVMSLSTDPFISLENVQHVVLLGLTFQEGRGDGIQIKGGADCLIANCTVRRMGGDAILVQGGVRHGVFGCYLHTLGCGGIRMDGGDRQALTPGNHFVENCTVSDISRIKRTYAPAVHLDGCGNRVAHNLFERIPSSAMRIEGNDHLIELNHVRKVVQESDDQGGIDMFGNPLYRGVVLRWNRWSDIIGGTECGAAGIRLDDMISGIVLQGNLFERCGAVQFGAVQIHGGKENVVDGNVFIDCHAAISCSRWDAPRWLKSIEPFLKQAGQEPYLSRYPALAQLNSEPNVNYFSRNVLFGCKNVFLREGGVNKSVLMAVSEDSILPDQLGAENTKDPKLRQALLESIPVDEMGPYSHAWRASTSLAEAPAPPRRSIPAPLPGHPGNIFVEGEEVIVRLPESMRGETAPFRLINDRLELVRSVDTQVQESPSGAHLPLGRLGLGWYRLDSGATNKADTIWTSLAVLPRLREPTPLDSPVCIDSAAAWFARDNPGRQREFANLAALAGVNWVRDRLRWRDVQPSPGELTRSSTTYDTSAKIHHEAGLQVLQVFHDTPPWASEGPESTGRFAPDLRKAFEFCRALALRFKGTVAAWEPWNEANIATFGGHTVDQMCSWQKAAWLGFKAGDPGVTVGWNVTAALPTPAHTEGLLANETWPYYDTYNIHTYDWSHAYHDLWKPAREAAAGRPLWITEADRGTPHLRNAPWYDQEPRLERLKAEWMAQAYASSLFSGAKRHFHFILGNYQEPNGVQFGLLRLDLTPRPAYVALAAVGRYLAGARALGRWQSGQNVNVYAFRAHPDGEERDVLVAWAEKEVDWNERGAAVADWTLPEGLKVEKVIGYLGRSCASGFPKPLTSAPVFVVMPPGESAKLPLQAPPAQSAWRPGDASPVVLQVVLPRSTLRRVEDLRWSEGYVYEVPAGTPLEFKLYAYNFSTNRASVRLRVARQPEDWDARLLHTELTIPPMERVEVGGTLSIPAAASKRDGWVQLAADGSECDGAKLAFRVVASGPKHSDGD